MKSSSGKEAAQPGYKMKVENDVFAKMRDGVKLACDIYRPDASGKFPAILTMLPYCKDVQALNIAPFPFNSEYASLEKGNSELLVAKGYVHVVADIRGSGKSEGNYDIMSKKEQEDGYDLVEWIAKQPWCDGNVGMIGISYPAIIQYLVAAQQPPHLKTIVPHDGWGDMYRDIAHHGGIMMPGWLANWANIIIASHETPPASASLYSKKELEALIEKWKNNPIVNKSPALYMQLVFPNRRPVIFDWLINEFDGPYYWERSAYTKYDKIKIPVLLGSEMHHYPVVMHLPGAFSAWEGIKSPKKLVIRPSVPMRPFVEYHDDIIKWYDHWLKGIDNGVMDEPPIKIWIRAADEWIHGTEWPLTETKWADYYLKSNGKLGVGQQAAEEAPDGFTYKPIRPLLINQFPMDPLPEHVEYTTEPLDKDLKIVGPIALYLHASLSGDDAHFIAKVKDVPPEGTETVLSRGWLKASHRAIDNKKSKPWQPYHPHTKESVKPVNPEEINEYAIEIRPIANLFKKGHRIKIEIWGCDYPLMQKDGIDFTLAWPGWAHLPFEYQVSYKIYHSHKYPSRLVLPVIPVK